MEQESNAKTCASLVLQLAEERAHWASTLALQAGGDPLRHSPSCLLDQFGRNARILRSRVGIASHELKTGTSNEAFSSVVHLKSPERDAVFIARSIWSFW